MEKIIIIKILFKDIESTKTKKKIVKAIATIERLQTKLHSTKIHFYNPFVVVIFFLLLYKIVFAFKTLGNFTPQGTN